MRLVERGITSSVEQSHNPTNLTIRNTSQLELDSLQLASEYDGSEVDRLQPFGPQLRVQPRQVSRDQSLQRITRILRFLCQNACHISLLRRRRKVGRRDSAGEPIELAADLHG